MKKPTNSIPESEDEMRAEYDFTGGVRGKHYHALQTGYTITIHQADGTTVVKEVKPTVGHKSSKTTEIYTHVSNKSIGRIKSPLDSLDIRPKEEGDSGR